MEKGLYLDLPVPRWEQFGQQLWVRYRPANPALFMADIEKREKAHATQNAANKRGDPDRLIKANADLLVRSCDAVFTLPLDQQPPKELPDDYPTFGSPELSEAVGAVQNAVETARSVYATDGDLMLAAQQVLEWSGTATKKADDDFLDG